MIPAFLERLGCKVIRLNDEPDGEFPHPPEPNVRNMKGVASVVESVEADLGISVNADADRLGFVAAGGTALSEEYVFPIVADYLLDSTRGPVVSTLSTSRMVESAAARHGRKVIYARIGEGYVVEKVQSEKAAVGGEGSGGVVVPRWNRWFDAFSTAAIVLQCMARTEATLDELANRLPRYYLLKGALPSPSERTYPILEAFRRRYQENSPNLDDGVRVDWPDAWLHVRASNTEPLVRIIVEAEGETRARDLYDQSIDQIAQLQAGRGNE